GDPFDVRHPTEFLVQVNHPAGVDAGTVLATVDDELSRVATGGLRPGGLDRGGARVAAQPLRGGGRGLGRGPGTGGPGPGGGRGELLLELPGWIGAVTADQVAVAAGTLTADRRAVVELLAGGAR